MERPPLGYAGIASLRSATATAEDKRIVVIQPAPNGRTGDIVLPSSNDKTTLELLAGLANQANIAASGVGGDTLIALSKSSLAGELYVQQVEGAVAHCVNTGKAIAADYVEVRKFTPEHAKRILDARLEMLRALKVIVPPKAAASVTEGMTGIASVDATARLAADVQAMQSLEGRSLQNLARNAVRRIEAAPTFDQDLPAIAMDSKLAARLKTFGNVVQVIELMPPAIVLITSDDRREQENALAQLGGKITGSLVEKAIQSGGPALCVMFGVSTMGYGFLACGLISVGVGIYAGKEVESRMTKVLSAPPSKP